MLNGDEISKRFWRHYACSKHVVNGVHLAVIAFMLLFKKRRGNTIINSVPRSALRLQMIIPCMSPVVCGMV
eukprot:1151714-Pelagomonas_calceolata.AAC.2